MYIFNCNFCSFVSVDGNIENLSFKKVIYICQTLLITVYGAYFAGRSMKKEK